jgi:peptide deformylase
MELIKAPNEWLEKQVDPFDFDSLDAKEIEKEMIDIMLKNNGIGLAANQVGLNAQIFVMHPIDMEGIEENLAIINPKVLAVNQDEDSMVEGEEGCLSHPGLILKVRRPKSLVAEFLDSDNNSRIINFVGINARCFAHEYDHLQGIDFTDRVSRLKLDMAKKKQKKRIKNGRT